MTQLRDRLKEIKTFPSLVKFLRDELDWPIESTDDFEDLTFDYTPEELGIDAVNAAKIEEIKRLRPLAHNQPITGIFFVKFEPKQLPVVALRRILNRVVVRKRAIGSAAEQQRWATDDLLFISAYGGEDERRISFAHFSQDPEKGALPTLKVLAWDEQDTGLHLDDVATRLVEHLSWPTEADEWDDETWRERWSSAFELRHREVVTTSKALAIELAALARAVRSRINAVLEIESDDGPVTGLMNAFREALVHDLEPDDFADMYAQTIAYGLLSARIANPSGTGSAEYLPVTNPFLRELMETFLHVGGGFGDRDGIDFDELGVSDVVELLDDANMEAVILDFGDKNPLEDPVIHFYEVFLKEYDAKKRMQRGVFYTPRPVVSFIVRSVHELLRTEFGLEGGLADTATWSQVAEHMGLEIPEGVNPGDRFVTVLDPATGTGTFLVEAIDVIHRTLVETWEQEGRSDTEIGDLWNEYVPKHLLPRLHGYELLMAPYAIAHLKVGLKLYETGYRFHSNERAQIYLTNALEPAQDFSDRFEFAVPALAHEAEAVNSVKDRTRFSVVIGNPPYAQMSQNLGATQRELVAPYRFLDGQRIVERGAITFERNLQDDYVKFVRLAEFQVERASLGVVGMITNHVFLGSLSLRGMRCHLVKTFQNLRFLDLHGNSKIGEEPPIGIVDENVFDIQQGVAVSLLSRRNPKDAPHVTYAEIWGRRDDKYEALNRLAGPDTLDLAPSSPNYLFVPHDAELAAEYGAFLSLTDIFEVYGSAITTARDAIVVDFDDQPIIDRVAVFDDRDRTNDDVLSTLGIRESAIWNVASARSDLSGVDPRAFIVDVDYRPFDTRRLFYNDALVSSPRHPTMDHMGQVGSLALAVCRQQSVPGFRHVFVSRRRFDEGLVSNRSREKTVCFPLLLSVAPSDGSLIENERRVNLRPSAIAGFSAAVEMDWQETEATSDSLSPNRLLEYMYAVLHSPGYRQRYEHELKRDFPRVPFPRSGECFVRLTESGHALIAVHLGLETPRLASAPKYQGPPRPLISRVAWSDEAVWIDATESAGTVGWTGVSLEAWEFQIGSYQVCHKWLKDRKGRVLSDDDIAHYQKLVLGISETIRLMKEIDEVIDEHGGWPGAFVTSSTGSE